MDLSTKEEKAMNLTASITQFINNRNPVITGVDLNDLYTVLQKFCEQYLYLPDDLPDSFVDEYLLSLFHHARKLDANVFHNNPYIQDVSISREIQIGNYRLLDSGYQAGELFLYDFPDEEGGYPVPCLGYFTEPVRFPAVYQGNIPWMSVVPSEINTMKEPLRRSFGKVLTLGLGLGYFSYMAARKPDVSSVTSVDISPEIIDLYTQHIHPQLNPDDANKIHVVQADAFAYLDTVKPGQYDFIFADLWHGSLDGLPLYTRLKPYEKKLPGTVFTYWIKDYLK